MFNKYLKLQLLFFTLILAVVLSCEQSGKSNSERLVFSVQTSAEFPVNAGPAGENVYSISADSGAFFIDSAEELMSGPTFTPQALIILISLRGQLIETILNPNGYRVKTQIALVGGDIIITHTNQAYLVEAPNGDSLYAIRGEGVVSSGTGIFENISGLFYEESTFLIDESIGEVEQPSFTIDEIRCKYELLVDF